jgi:streptogramin lyase
MSNRYRLLALAGAMMLCFPAPLAAAAAASVAPAVHTAPTSLRTPAAPTALATPATPAALDPVLLADYASEFLDYWKKQFQKQNTIMMSVLGVGIVALFIITRSKWRK